MAQWLVDGFSHSHFLQHRIRQQSRDTTHGHTKLGCSGEAADNCSIELHRKRDEAHNPKIALLACMTSCNIAWVTLTSSTLINFSILEIFWCKNLYFSVFEWLIYSVSHRMISTTLLSCTGFSTPSSSSSSLMYGCPRNFVYKLCIIKAGKARSSSSS